MYITVYLGSKLCNSLLIGIKDAISLTGFKEGLKSWDEPCD